MTTQPVYSSFEPPFNMRKHIVRQSLSLHLHIIKPRSISRARILGFQPHPMRGSGLFIPIYSITHGLNSIAATRRYICKDACTMKRKDRSVESPSASKRIRTELPEYHATPPVRDEHGVVIWPAPEFQIERARAMILDW